MLDYGAAIAREIGGTPDPVATLSAKLPGIDLRARILEEFNADGEERDGVEDILDGLRECLRQGRLTFVVLMDSLDDRLRDLIAFVNQFSQFTILAVEAQFYRHDANDIVIPTLYGAERIKPPVVPRRVWDEQRFFEALAASTDERVVAAGRRVYDFMLAAGAKPSWGRGETGGFNPPALSWRIRAGQGVQSAADIRRTIRALRPGGLRSEGRRSAGRTPGGALQRQRNRLNGPVEYALSPHDSREPPARRRCSRHPPRSTRHRRQRPVVCERKKRAAEALSCNALVQSFPELERLAKEPGRKVPAQASMLDAEDE